MSEEPKARGPWDALAGLIPHDLKEMVGMLIVFFIFMAIFMALGKLPKYFDSLADSPSKQYCWSLMDVRGVLIKFNQCTGETTAENIKIPTEQLSPATTPTQPLTQQGKPKN